MSTVQELASTFIDLRTEDQEALSEWARTESETFEAFASAYLAPARPCGKGCH
ncbi:hypothetical protein [Pseudonocardia nigra]|uniref:hypothetical protein n=1 Tax=Pseudonocardia nigra TaxID=1921578 RepID=UPI001C5E175B|nr:hypothetical protein [Pseudonocardia nigra]